MTLREVTQLVALGEGPVIEFKQRVPQPERIAKEAIAFANTQGGHIFLGVSDDGEIKGLKDAEEEVYLLQDALAKHCQPQLAYQMERIAISRKREVILVRIFESKKKPHYLVEADGKQTVYIRVDDVSREASREAIRLMRLGGKESEVMFQFGDKELALMRYLDSYGRITVDQFAKLVHIPRRRASHTLVLLTRASVLDFHESTDSDYFTRAYRADGT